MVFTVGIRYGNRTEEGRVTLPRPIYKPPAVKGAKGVPYHSRKPESSPVLVRHGEEIWKDIQGYEGLYQVSCWGRVKSLERMKYSPHWGFQRVREKILKAAWAGGYLGVDLCKHGVAKMTGVHLLVANAFLPNPDNLPEINHKSADRSDNTPGNLEWITRRGNIEHAMKMGLMPRGSTHGNSKLKDEDIPVICERLLTGESAVSISRDYPVLPGVIKDIRRGARWVHAIPEGFLTKMKEVSMALNRREKEKRELRFVDAKEWVEKQDAGFEPTCIKPPEGVGFWSLNKKTPGTFALLDFMAYVVGKGNPDADEGMVHFTREYRCHRNLGVDGKKSYPCLRMFNEPCPICEWLESDEGRALDKDTWIALRDQKRMLFAVIDVSNEAERAKGFQILDQAYFKGFGELLKAKINSAEHHRHFFKPTREAGGMTLQLSISKDSFKGRAFNKITNIEMVPRKYDYDLDMVDQAPCLDDCLVHMSYAELEKAFLLRPGQAKAAATPEPVREGSYVAWTSKKGKAMTGTVVEINEARGEAEVEVEGYDEPIRVDLELLSPATPEVPVGSGPPAASRRPSPPDTQTSRPSSAKVHTDGEGKIVKTFKPGSWVEYKGKEWEVDAIGPDGNMIVSDDEGKTIKGVDPARCKAVLHRENLETEEEEEAPRPAAQKKGKKTQPPPPEEDEDLDEEDEDSELEEEEEEPEEEEPEEEEEEEPEEEEEEEPPARGRRR